MKYYPNILIVKGTGRNVGKTLSSCVIIEKLAKKNNPIAVKISPHFHELDKEQRLICKSNNFIIVEEKNINSKDSSRMLQAGAEKVFYVQSDNKSLPDVLADILKYTKPNQPIVIETGGLYDYMEPGLLLYIVGENPKKQVKVRKKTNAVKVFSVDLKKFNWNSIQFKNNKFNVDVGI